MHANVGDRIVVHGLHVDDPDRDGEILEVRGSDGSPPYLVRWSADGHVGLFFPTVGTAIAPKVKIAARH